MATLLWQYSFWPTVHWFEIILFSQMHINLPVPMGHGTRPKALTVHSAHMLIYILKS